MVSQNLSKDVTVYIGRFEPFHLGHAHVLLNSLTTSKLTIVLIGSSGQARSLKNPFTYAERKSMIERFYDTINYFSPNVGDIRIIPIRDYPYNDTEWISNVQLRVKQCITEYCFKPSRLFQQNLPFLKDIWITGSNRDETCWYLNSFPQWKSAIMNEHNINGVDLLSATEVRRLMFDEQQNKNFSPQLAKMLPESTIDFISEFMKSDVYESLVKEYKANKAYKESWANSPYPPTFVTCDAVVIQSGYVLVVKRGAYPGKGLLALPGGFVNQQERLKDCAIRELMEETGIRLTEGKKSEEMTKTILSACIQGNQFFDNPDRSLRGRTITVAFLFRLDDTKPLPKVKGQNTPFYETGNVPEVETLNAFWMPISQALSETDQWFEDHLAILSHFIGISGNR
jgi:bifunctional NMN adenylyltransferase/nudix hydrolase